AVQHIGKGERDMEPIGGVFLAPEGGAPALTRHFLDFVGIFRLHDVPVHAYHGFGSHGLDGRTGSGELHMSYFSIFPGKGKGESDHSPLSPPGSGRPTMAGGRPERRGEADPDPVVTHGLRWAGLFVDFPGCRTRPCVMRPRP